VLKSDLVRAQLGLGQHSEIDLWDEEMEYVFHSACDGGHLEVA